MKRLINILFTATIIIFSLQGFAAVNIVECEDKEGNRSFQKTCPPGSTMVGKKKISTGGGLDSSSKSGNIQVILYLVPDCDVCDEVKEFLNVRNISITEKNVKDDIELQNELNELVGALKVPTTVIGDEIVSGYNRNSFKSALEAAGYIYP